MAVCISLDWIVGGPVNVICIAHSSDRMVGPLPPCQQPCYRHASVLGLDNDTDNDKDKDKDADKHKHKHMMTESLGLYHPANNLVTAMLV